MRVLTHATVTERCGTNDGSRCPGVEVHTRDGVVRSIRANIVVVCAGGIQNAWILQHRTASIPRVWLTTRTFGRPITDHPRETVAHVDKEDFARTQRIFGGRHSWASVIHGWVGADPARRAIAQLFCLGVTDSRPCDPFDAMSALRSRNGNTLRHVGNGVQSSSRRWLPVALPPVGAMRARCINRPPNA